MVQPLRGLTSEVRPFTCDTPCEEGHKGLLPPRGLSSAFTLTQYPRGLELKHQLALHQPSGGDTEAV